MIHKASPNSQILDRDWLERKGKGTDTEIGGERGYGKRIIRMHYIQL